MKTISAANTTVTCDGNSITAGILWTSGPSAYYPAQLSQMPPIAGQFTVANLGVSGQTTRQMNGLDGGSAADVDARFVEGKDNILFVWEGTNSADTTTRTGEQIAQDLADYVAARLALHPEWIIVLMTALPFIRSTDSQATKDSKNARLDVMNALIRANFRTWGAKAVLDLRAPGSPFAIADYTLASFETPALMQLWANESAGTHIHLKDAGMTYIANACAGVLTALPQLLDPATTLRFLLGPGGKVRMRNGAPAIASTAVV